MAESVFDTREGIRAPGTESDDFWINDVQLKIPPTQIRVSKQSFNKQYSTIRTRASQKLKSGHSIAHISLDVIFQGDSDINDKLRRVVAGLRSTPYCVVENSYIEGQLRGVDTVAAEDESSNRSYKRFNPIVLAMTSMTFTTMSDVDMVDCVRGQFDFLWFNYLPYTPSWIYKTGSLYDKPGTVRDSELWRKFYSPYLAETESVTWPHEGTGALPTSLFYREYLLVPRGDPNSITASIDLIGLIQNKPKQFNDAFIHVVDNDERATGSNTLELTIRKLIKSGKVDVLQSLRDQKILDRKGLSSSGGAVVYPLIRKLNQLVQQSGKTIGRVVNENQGEINSAINTLVDRRKALKNLEKKGIVINDLKEVKESFQGILDVNAKLKSGDQEASPGGFRVLARKNKLRLHTGGASVIEQITISFRNTLAMIPMVGYRYPTCQHIGSIDADVQIVLNADNRQTRSIQRTYDTVETMALRFKQIPQGFHNITIENDFLKLFGINEFLTNNIEANTIPEQPGRSHIALGLTQANITSKTTFDDPENLRQEFVVTSQSFRQKIWDVLDKNLRERGRKNPNNLTTFSIKDYQLLPRSGPDTRHLAFYQLLIEAAVAYDTFLKEADKAVFGGSEQEGSIAYAELWALTENMADIGFIPGIKRLQNYLGAKKAFLENTATGTNVRLGKSVSLQTRIEQLKSNNFRRRMGLQTRVVRKGDKLVRRPKLEKGAGISGKTIPELVAKKQDILNEAGLRRYVDKMTALLDKIDRKYLALDQLKHLIPLKKQLGLGTGSLAYPDFAPSLQAAAGILGGGIGNAFQRFFGGNSPSSAELIKFEPDFYLWYEFFSGSRKGLTRIVDQRIIATAQKLSQRAYESARGNVDAFFQGTYRSLLGSEWKVPFDALTAGLKSHRNNKGNELVPPFYESESWSNSSLSEDIQKTIAIDGISKAPVNWFTSRDGPKPKIKGDLVCEHTTDFGKWLGGVSTGAAPERKAMVPPASSSHPEREIPKPKRAPPDTKKPGEVWLEGIHRIRARYIFGPFPKIVDTIVMHKPGYTGSPNKPYRVANYFKNAHRDTKRGQKLTASGHKRNIVSAHFVIGMEGTITQCVPVNKRAAHAGSRGPSGDFNRRSIGIEIDGSVKQAVTPAQIQALANLIPAIQQHHPSVKYAVAHSDISNRRSDPGPLFPWDKIETLGLTRKTPSALNKAERDRNTRAYTPRPGSAAARRSAQLASKTPQKGVTSTLTSPLGHAIAEFERDLLRGQAQSLRRAYPTFKLYFIEDDSQEGKRLAFDDFFSYNSVKSIRVTRSRKIAADLCVLELVNVSGTLSNKKFRQQQDAGTKPRNKAGLAEESRSPGHRNTRKENPITSLLLQEGMNIHLRLGYSSDPAKLDTVFNGVITGVEFSENEDLVTVIAQSYAVELVQDIKGIEKPKKKDTSGVGNWFTWGFSDEATTGRILEEVISEPEVIHFGRWTPSTTLSSARDILTNKWQFVANPADDNIFAPPPGQDVDTLGDGWFFKSLEYIIYRTTIWDIFKEMELRHPNMVASPVPYEDAGGRQRMTMFFGLPNQLYFARHPDAEEQLADERLKAAGENVKSKRAEQAARNLAKALPVPAAARKAASTFHRTNLRAVGGLAKYFVGEELGKAVGAATRLSEKKSLLTPLVQASAGFQAYENVADNTFREARLTKALEAGYIKPFRNYHLITSASHIVSNNIRANSRDVANTIVIKYPGKKVEFGLNISLKDDEQTFILKQDTAIPTEDMRTQMGQFVNVHNDALAKRYALGLLHRNVKEIYKGDICVLGMPKVKPLDVIYIFDEYTDMVGPAEVEQVTHIFSQETGFITEIVPDMLCAVSEWSLLSSCEALGVVMEGVIRELYGRPADGRLGKSMSPWPWMVGAGLYMFGGFMSNKIINYTQLGQPIVMSPLALHGRPFTGGIPTRKIPSSIWTTIFGEYSAEYDAGYDTWKEAVYDRFITWVEKVTGQHSTGSFSKGFSSNTLGK
jgi:hypothetical protein